MHANPSTPQPCALDNSSPKERLIQKINDAPASFSQIDPKSAYRAFGRGIGLTCAVLCLFQWFGYYNLHQWGSLPSLGQLLISGVLMLVAFTTDGVHLFLVACFAVLTALSF